MPFPSSVRSVEVEQQVRFGFSLDYVKNFVSTFKAVDRFAYILHDKDVKENGDPVEPHVHLVVHFSNPVPVVNLLSAFSGVCELQNFETIKKWKAAVAYLTHENRPEKHRYGREEVFSNYDFSPEIDEALSASSNFASVIEAIGSGVIRRFDIVDRVSVSDYVKYRKQIEDAFAYRDLYNFREVNRDMKVLYFYGPSGCGKTTFAKMLAADRGFSCFVSGGGKDFLDGYAGQDCIVLDDFRGSVAPLSVVLKLLDNNTASSVPSRYRNKSISECKLIIITTIKPPEELFRDVFESDNEPFAQFSRRCEAVYAFSSKMLSISRWDNVKGEFVFLGDLVNPVSARFEEVTEEEARERVLSTLGSFGKFFVSAADAFRSSPGLFESNGVESQCELPFP